MQESFFICSSTMESALLSMLEYTDLPIMIHQYNKKTVYQKFPYDSSKDALLHLSCTSKAFFGATENAITSSYFFIVERSLRDYENFPTPKRTYKHFSSTCYDFDQSPEANAWLHELGYYSAESLMLLTRYILHSKKK